MPQVKATALDVIDGKSKSRWIPTKRVRSLGISVPIAALAATLNAPAVAQTSQIFDNYNSSVECSFADRATFTVKEAIQGASASVWFDFGGVNDDVRFTLTQSGRAIQSGIIRKADCAKGYTWCNGLMNLGDLAPGAYVVTVSPGRICQNSRNDGGNGFIKVAGRLMGTGNSAAPSATGYWRLIGITTPDQRGLKSPWSVSHPCSEGGPVETSWSIPQDHKNSISTLRRSCGPPSEQGKTWSGKASWTLLPTNLIPETKIPISISVSGGRLYWLGITENVDAAPGEPPFGKSFEWKVPIHGAYAGLSEPTHTWSLRFNTGVRNNSGAVVWGDPDVTIYYTYEWVPK